MNDKPDPSVWMNFQYPTEPTDPTERQLNFIESVARDTNDRIRSLQAWIWTLGVVTVCMAIPLTAWITHTLTRATQ